MPSAHIRKGNAWKNGYSNYKTKGQYEKNRKRDLNHHLEDHPTDKVAEKALSTIKYRRKKPAAKQGWVTGKIMFAMMGYIGVDKKEGGFSGQHAKATQMKIAQYMKMSRKSQNSINHSPKKTAKK